MIHWFIKSRKININLLTYTCSDRTAEILFSLQVKSMRVDAIIRQGIKRFTDQIGLLWNSLADYYTRNANFEKAKDIYEEAIQTVTTVRDFTQVRHRCPLR